MDQTHTPSPRKAAQSRGFSASLRRLAARRATMLMAAGTLLLTAGAAGAASQTYTGPGLFSTGFGGTAVSGNTLVFGGATPTTVNNDLTGLILGAGTNSTNNGTYLGDAIDFTGTTAYTLTGNDVQQQGNIVNSSSVMQTISFNLLTSGAAGLSSPPYGYTFDSGAGGLTFNGNIGAIGQTGGVNNFHDFIKIGAGNLNLNGNNTVMAASFFNGGLTTINGTVTDQYFAQMNNTSNLSINGTFTSLNSSFVVFGTSIITVNSGGVFNQGNYIGEGTGANATYNILGSGQFRVTGDFNISDVSGTQGTLNVGSVATDTALVDATGQNFWVGKSTNTVGTMNVKGGTVNLGTLHVADTGTSQGTVTQTGGAVVQAGAGNDWRIGGYNGTGDAAAVGVYNISAGSLTTPDNFQIGAYGSGTLNQTGGTVTTTNGYTDAGRFAGSVGIINVTGGTFNQNGATRLFAGEEGTGTITVGGTGVINSVGGVTIANDAAGQGTVNLNTGGTLNTIFVAGGTGTGGSVLNFNGGTLTATAASTTFVSGLTAANVQAGGAIFDTNGNAVTVTQNLLHSGAGRDGGLTKVGAGTLTLSGADTYTGATKVSAGQLSVTTIASLGAGSLLLPSSSADWVNLLFTGTETINSLSFNLGNSFVTPGTYGAVGSSASNQFAAFTGSGVLNVVAAPEPSQYAAFGLGLLGLGGLALRARRRSAA
jgi:autotransporter-associated beta strand protein